MIGLVLLWCVYLCEGRAVRLLRPCGDHSGFEVEPEGVEFLESVKGPLALVAAVGGIHTGKSFMLNQLLDRQEGFSLGYKVTPETSGVWVWSAPLRYRLVVDHGQTSRYLNDVLWEPFDEEEKVWEKNEQKKSTNGREQNSSRLEGNSFTREVNIVFLDTEGFHGPNVSKDYDASLYALTTLISSEVLFTSMKMMDSRDLQYIEQLTRHANLFKLRAYKNMFGKSATLEFEPAPTQTVEQVEQDILRGAAEEKDEDYYSDHTIEQHNENTSEQKNISQFVESLTQSRLAWVVQDFVQDFGDDSSPVQWLDSLLASRRIDLPMASGRSAAGGEENVAENMKNNMEENMGKNNIHKKFNSTSTTINKYETYEGIRNLFSSINCVTLPAPSWQTEVLQKLDKYTINDEQYLNSFVNFKRDLFDRAALSPKSFENHDKGNLANGHQIAQILIFLVSSVNQNLYPSFASLVTQFNQMEAGLVKGDLLDVYREAMTKASDLTPPPFEEYIDKLDRSLRTRLVNLWEAQLGSSAHEDEEDEAPKIGENNAEKIDKNIPTTKIHEDNSQHIQINQAPKTPNNWLRNTKLEFHQQMNHIKQNAIKKSMSRVGEHCRLAGVQVGRKLAATLASEVYPRLPLVNFQNWISLHKLNTMRDYHQAINTFRGVPLQDYPHMREVLEDGVGDASGAEIREKVDRNGVTIPINAKKIEKKSEKIEKKSEKIEKNSEKIEKNYQKIDKNSKKIGKKFEKIETIRIEKMDEKSDEDVAKVERENCEENGKCEETIEGSEEFLVDLGNEEKLGWIPALSISENYYSGLTCCAEKMDLQRRVFVKLYRDLVRSNYKALLAVLEGGKEAALKNFQYFLNSAENAKHFEKNYSAFEEVLVSWKAAAFARFVHIVGESLFESLGLTGREFTTKISLELDRFVADGLQIWRRRCAEVTNQVISKWEASFRPYILENVSLPTDQELLSLRVRQITLEAEREMEQIYCAEHAVWVARKKVFDKILFKEARAVEDLNISEFALLVKEPLSDLKQDLVAQCKNYYVFEHSWGLFTPFARVAFLNASAVLPGRGKEGELGENVSGGGKTGGLSGEMRRKVITRWIEDEIRPECMRLIVKKYKNAGFTLSSFVLPFFSGLFAYKTASYSAGFFSATIFLTMQSLNYPIVAFTTRFLSSLVYLLYQMSDALFGHLATIALGVFFVGAVSVYIYRSYLNLLGGGSESQSQEEEHSSCGHPRLSEVRHRMTNNTPHITSLNSQGIMNGNQGLPNLPQAFNNNSRFSYNPPRTPSAHWEHEDRPYTNITRPTSYFKDAQDTQPKDHKPKIPNRYSAYHS